MFPKHNILPADGNNPLFKEAEQKGIGFSPLPFCEFFQGMEVLELYGEETVQYVFGVYACGRLVGALYFGNLFNDKSIAQIKKQYLPKTWDEIDEYVNTKVGVKYKKMHPSQYAFVFEKVLKKIE